MAMAVFVGLFVFAALVGLFLWSITQCGPDDESD